MSAEGDAIKEFFTDHEWEIISDFTSDSVNEDNFYTKRGQCMLWVFIDNGMVCVDEKSFYHGKTKRGGRILTGRFEMANPECFDELNGCLEKVMDNYEY